MNTCFRSALSAAPDPLPEEARAFCTPPSRKPRVIPSAQPNSSDSPTETLGNLATTKVVRWRVHTYPDAKEMSFELMKEWPRSLGTVARKKPVKSPLEFPPTRQEKSQAPGGPAHPARSR